MKKIEVYREKKGKKILLGISIVISFFLVMTGGAYAADTTYDFNDLGEINKILSQGSAVFTYQDFKFSTDGGGDDGLDYWPNFGLDSSGGIAIAASDAGDIKTLTIKRTDSQPFAFKGIWLNNDVGDPSITIKGYLIGNPTGDQDSFSISTSVTKTYDWVVDEIKIEGVDLAFFFDNFSFGDAVVNAVPSIAIDGSVITYTENNTAIQIDAAGTLNDTDGDADWNGGTLSVQISANAETADEITIPDNVVGNINTSGMDIKDGTTVIGTLSASEGTVTNGTKLTITFNSNVTNALVQQVMRAVHYGNTSDDIGTSNRTVTFTATDKNSASASDTRTISITAVNDKPTLTAAGTNPTFTEDGSAATLFNSALASTIENGQTLSSFTMTVSNVNDGSSEKLNIDGTAITLTNGTSGTTATNSLSYSVSVTGTTATVSLSGGTLSSSTFQTLINGMAYENNNNMPNTSNRVVTITSATDSGGGNDTATLSIASIVTVVGNNDAPTLTSFASMIDTTIQNKEVEVTLDDLKTQGNEGDVDGTVNAFIVKAVSTGTLKIGTDSGSATAFDAINNKTIDSTNKAYWTPGNNHTGQQNAFTVVAVDDKGLESVGAVQATVTVNPLSIAFTTTSSNGNESVSSATLQVDIPVVSSVDVSVDYTVTGTASGSGSDYTLDNGTVIISAGTTMSGINITNIVDDLLDENNETVIVTLSSPSNASLGTNTVHTYTINDNDAAPTITFNSVSSSGDESVDNANLQVDLSAVSGLNVVVDYTITGTASGSGIDYTLGNGTLTIIAGDITNNITIATIVDDLLDENNETVVVTLSSPSNASLGTNTVHTYTINDDDATPTVAFNATSSNGDESVSSVNLQVALSAESGLDVTVDYAITGTASGSGTDYTLANGTLTINEDDLTKNITIATIVDDLLDENNETVIVTLSNPINATLGTNKVHTYTINDNDATPTIAFNATSSNGDESVSSANLQVDLSAVSGLSVSVDYTVTGTASGSGIDYTLDDGILTINAGEANKNINIANILDDFIDETDETVIVTISSPTNATLGTNTVYTYTINDNDTVGFTIIESAGNTQVSETGTTDTVTIVLDAQPISNVVLDITSGNTNEATVDKSSLTFTNGNWNVPQTVTMTGVDDMEKDDNKTTNITISINDTNSDDAFDSVTDQLVSVTTIDDDVPGFTITQTDGNTQVSEMGTTDTFTVKLNIEPSSDVVLNISNGDTGEIIADKTNLTFTDTNWNVQQTVSITGVDDNIMDGNQTTDIIISVNAGASHDDFDFLDNQSISVTTTDDDVPGFTITQTGGNTEVSETGATDTVTIVLNMQPTSKVVLIFSNVGIDEVTASPSSVTFTNANWNIAQTVTMTGIDDTVLDGNQTTQITVSVDDANSEDSFDTVSDQLISVITKDNEVPPSSHNNSHSQPTTQITVEVNGEKQTSLAQAETKNENGQRVTTVTIDGKKLEEKLQKEGQNATVTIPLKNQSGTVKGQLNGKMIQNMEAKEATLEIQTEKATYTLPAGQIKIDGISKALGTALDLKDINVEIQIGETPKDMVKVVENSANKDEFTLVVPPVDFTVTCSYKNKNVDVKKFSSYVERTIAIPDDVNPEKITTGIVIYPDGTTCHVPTQIIKINGKYYVKIYSLTNSTYSVIWNPKEYSDLENHWVKDIGNEMASRMIVEEETATTFNPEEKITRLFFTKTMVRALGLGEKGTEGTFADVDKTKNYFGAVSTAVEYELIKGYTDNTFKAENKITREEAAALMVRAMKIAGLKTDYTEAELAIELNKFVDSKNIEPWAKNYVGICAKNRLIVGNQNNEFLPKNDITKAELATIIKRMLEKAELI